MSFPRPTPPYHQPAASSAAGSTSLPGLIMWHRQPLSHQPVSHPSLSHQSLSHPSLSHPSLSHPSLSHPSLSHPSLSHPSLSHQSLSHQPLSYQPLSHQSLIHQPVSHQSLIHQPVSHQSLIHQPVSHQLLNQPPVSLQPFSLPTTASSQQCLRQGMLAQCGTAISGAMLAVDSEVEVTDVGQGHGQGQGQGHIQGRDQGHNQCQIQGYGQGQRQVQYQGPVQGQGEGEYQGNGQSHHGLGQAQGLGYGQSQSQDQRQGQNQGHSQKQGHGQGHSPNKAEFHRGGQGHVQDIGQSKGSDQDKTNSTLVQMSGAEIEESKARYADHGDETKTLQICEVEVGGEECDEISEVGSSPMSPSTLRMPVSVVDEESVMKAAGTDTENLHVEKGMQLQGRELHKNELGNNMPDKSSGGKNLVKQKLKGNAKKGNIKGKFFGEVKQIESLDTPVALTWDAVEEEPADGQQPVTPSMCDDFFACEFCHKQYASRETLSRHRKIHTHGKQHRCSDCARDFSRKYQLMKHVRKQHPGSATAIPMGSPPPPKVTTNKQSLTFERESLAGTVRCKTCLKFFKGAAALKEHMEKCIHNVKSDSRPKRDCKSTTKRVKNDEKQSMVATAADTQISVPDLVCTELKIPTFVPGTSCKTSETVVNGDGSREGNKKKNRESCGGQKKGKGKKSGKEGEVKKKSDRMPAGGVDGGDEVGSLLDVLSPAPLLTTCPHCIIVFPNVFLYLMHMAFHPSYGQDNGEGQDPFTCRICEQQYHEPVAFNVHLFTDGHRSLLTDGGLDGDGTMEEGMEVRETESDEEAEACVLEIEDVTCDDRCEYDEGDLAESAMDLTLSAFM